MAEPQTQAHPGCEQQMHPEPRSGMDGYVGSGKLDVLVDNVAYQCPADSLEAISTQQRERAFHTTSSIKGLRGNKTLIDYSVWTPLIPATFPHYSGEVLAPIGGETLPG